jgi:glycosyltransferase involved in cell wall biosynthesis
MTVCETEPVHEAYGLLFERSKGAIIVTPSDFCKRIFESQFSSVKLKVLHHTTYQVNLEPRCDNLFNLPTDKYIFYHIGNIIDQRKNVKKIIEAFIRLQLPNALLVLKATCHTKVTWNIPGVFIINGLLDDLYIENLQKNCHCYVSFSNSEGVGMGAVEAACHNKPVIITDYGAPKEYIKTNYIIPCDRQCLLQDDFLFKKGFTWGKPDFEYLMKFMKECYDGNIKYINHQWTRDITNGKVIKRQIKELRLSSD